MSYQEKLKTMQKNWKESKKTADQFELFPAGTYVMKLKSSEIGSRDNGSVYILSRWVSLEDETKGRQFSEFQNLHEDRLGFVHRWFNSMGFQAPDEITDIPETLEALVESGVVVKMSIKHTESNGTTYANGNIRGVVDYEDRKPVETTETEADAEAEAEEEPEPEPEPEPTKSKKKKGDSPEKVMLLAICTRSKIEADEKSSTEELAEFMNEWDWSVKKDKLAPDEVEIFDKYGIEYKK